MLTIEQTALPGVVAITPPRFADARGWFAETYNSGRWAAAGLILPEFLQDNHSYSAHAGTLRGLHYQAPPHGQGKLVRCTAGALFDVAVDIRQGSPTYGHWVSRTLSADNGTQLWIPEGFLHGFLALTDHCEVQYKCTSPYAPASDGAVRWDSCGIDWPTLDRAPILSENDATAVRLADFVSPFSVSPAP